MRGIEGRTPDLHPHLRGALYTGSIRRGSLPCTPAPAQKLTRPQFIIAERPLAGARLGSAPCCDGGAGAPASQPPWNGGERPWRTQCGLPASSVPA